MGCELAATDCLFPKFIFQFHNNGIHKKYCRTSDTMVFSQLISSDSQVRVKNVGEMVSGQGVLPMPSQGSGNTCTNRNTNFPQLTIFLHMPKFTYIYIYI
jgi:hypothetical protein